MNRIKVVNEPAELVPMLIAVHTPLRRKVFEEVTRDWCTAKQIEEKYGKKAVEALLIFEKMKLVETRWQTTPKSNTPEKAYHTYYSSFHISASCPISEMSDVLAVATMPEKEFQKIDMKIFRMVGEEGKFAGDIADVLHVSPTFLKSVIKRSTRLDYRGHRIERIKK